MNADLIPNSIVEVGTARFGNRLPLTLIAGPCALESRAHALEMAQALKEIAARLKIGLVYKTSFDKANRTSSNSARGMGLDQALPIFADIRDSLGVAVLTDVHEIEQCARVLWSSLTNGQRHSPCPSVTRHNRCAFNTAGRHATGVVEKAQKGRPDLKHPQSRESQLSQRGKCGSARDRRANP